ncbi:MAG: Gfo/Idh/MocA family oxidoreductase [Pseudomonadota bacterium]
MTEPIRWGILGAANFAKNQMAPAINAAKDAVLYGLATTSPAKAASFQAIAPGLHVYDSYDALLADAAIDAVYVPLPNHLHITWSLKALAAGKPVLTEKPIAMNASDIAPLIAARDSAGLLAAEAYMIVHHPQWQRARALYREGAIGTLQQIDGFFSYDNSADPSNIRNTPETGGGSLPDIGVYTIGSARFVTGAEPSDVTADIVWDNGVDATAHVTADLAGARFQATTSMRMHPRQEMTFHGSDGILRLTAPFNANVFADAELELHRNAPAGGAPSVTVERWTGVNQYVLQVEAFGRSIRDGADYPWSLEAAQCTQAVIDAALANAKGGTTP